MADSAFQTQYRQEWLAGYERNQSLLRQCCTTEAIIKGDSARFLIADSGGAAAVTRGLNGLIPSRPDNLTTTTCTLEEWHDKPIRTGFNIFASQGDARSIMQATSTAVMNRKVDDLILAQLATATNDTSTAGVMTLAKVMHAITILGNNNVPTDDGQVFGLLTPAAHAYLMQIPGFTSVDYVNGKPLTGGRKMYDWAGVHWMVHSGLPGLATNGEKCYVFHKSAIGHAMATSDIQTFAGYDEENDYSFQRITAYMGAKLLQNAGVVVINHDGSAYAAA